MPDNKPLATLETLPDLAILEGARIRPSPFEVGSLQAESGHSPGFLAEGDDGLATPVPRLSAEADLRAQAEGLVPTLHYRHFSLVFDARRKQPILAIVDVDGSRWAGIERRDVDIWYADPRMSPDDQPKAKHFGKPDPRIDPDKNHFAFGHMVRRLDPCWAPAGADEERVTAELQTFFLTNASPQAERLNSGPWNDLEDLVLNDLVKRLKIRAVILTGPIFDGERRVLIHDEMPVPSQYFKIVAWRSEGRLATAGWVQAQPAAVMPPVARARPEGALPFVERDPETAARKSLIWLTPIRRIAELTGLDLSAYEAGDTFELRRRDVRAEGIGGAPPMVVASADQLLITDVIPADDVEERSLLVRALRPMLANRERAEDTDSGAPEPLGEAVAAAESAVAPRISDRAFKLIVDYETGGRTYYERHYRKRAVWPKGASGITIGFGYDLGYVGTAEFRRDWGMLPAADRALLERTIGMKGGVQTRAQMEAALASVKSVVIEWEVAERVFRAATLPKFDRLTREALANTGRLPPDSYGALVSLTFNRGAAYSKHPRPGQRDRWAEMRGIRDAMAAGAFHRIPGLIRAMIPLWAGTEIEEGMRRRRTDEAALFERGLASAGTASPFSEAASLVAAAAEAADAGPAEAPEELDEAERWSDVTEFDLAAAAAAAPVFAEAAGRVSWAPDERSPDYAHIGQPAAVGRTYTLTADDLALLAELNAFDVDGERILFGLRGAMIVSSGEDGAVLKDVRPDHETPRCVMGVWNRVADTVSVHPGSTVPNAAAVRRWMSRRDMGNILPTGRYGYIVGTHNGKPGCFLLRKSVGERRTVVVRRSSHDLAYELGDLADTCQPGDNIHPTFHSGLGGFSSVGCQTVVGVATTGGSHSGHWARFRADAGLDKPDGTPFTYLLFTGAEARLASELRRAGLSGDPVSRLSLKRLRFGSSGPAVARLQAALGIADPDGDFGPATATRLHARQRALTGGSDGILTPAADEALGWGVFDA